MKSGEGNGYGSKEQGEISVAQRMTMGVCLLWEVAAAAAVAAKRELCGERVSAWSCYLHLDK